MIKILSENGNEKYGICHFTVDTQGELQNLPTNVEMGSVCFVISTSENYMLNSNKEWVKVNLGGGGSDEPPTIEVSDDGLITVTAGSDTATHQLSVEDNENFIASNIKNGINIFGTTGTAQTVVVPEVGFVPTAWNNNGYITEGIWYGETVPSNAFSFYTTTTDTQPRAMNALKKVIFNNIVTIGNYCFSNSHIEELIFPLSLTTINDYAFTTCKDLTEIDLPNSITNIKQYAFKESGLTSVSFPNNLTTIGQAVFQNCTSLTSVSFNQVNNLLLDQYLFDGCTSLSSITFPTGISYIGYGAFRGCTNLTTVTFEGTPTDGIYNTAFMNCSNLTIINVPWAEGTVSGAPWGATNATINYNYTPS